MTWSQVAGSEIVVRQRKTKATVRVPMLPELRAALEAVAADRRSTHLVVSETTGRPYTQYNFVARVRDVLDAAGLADKTFQDLRRSSVVRLAEAGASIPEIAAITGHSYAYCAQILEVYLPRTTPMARAAIARLLDSRPSD